MNKEESSKVALTIIGIFLGLSLFLFLLIYIILVKKIGELYKKIRK